MNINDIITFIPGFYYYKTRYDCLREGAMHILKYWGAYVLLLSLLSGGLSKGALITLIPAWLAFLSIYDIYSMENDLKSVKNENCPSFRRWRESPTQTAFVRGRLVITMLLVISTVLLAGTATAFLLCLNLCVLSIIFTLHNRIAERFRPTTYYMLYLTKGMLPLTVFINLLEQDALRTYLLFCTLFAATYIPQYSFRKLKGLSLSGVNYMDAGLTRYIVLQPILYKNLFIAVLSISSIHMIFLLVWIDSLTAIEAVSGKIAGFKQQS